MKDLEQKIKEAVLFTQESMEKFMSVLADPSKETGTKNLYLLEEKDNITQFLAAINTMLGGLEQERNGENTPDYVTSAIQYITETKANLKAAIDSVQKANVVNPNQIVNEEKQVALTETMVNKEKKEKKLQEQIFTVTKTPQKTMYLVEAESGIFPITVKDNTKQSLINYLNELAKKNPKNTAINVYHMTPVQLNRKVTFY